MIRKTATLALATLAAAATLAACGPTNDEAAPADTSKAAEATENTSDGGTSETVEDDTEEGSDTSFRLDDDTLSTISVNGAVIRMHFGAQPEDSDEVKWLEEYRQEAGGNPVSYVVSDVDARQSADGASASSVFVYDADGKEYECTDPEAYLHENWQPEWLYVDSDVDEYETASGEPMDYDTGERLSREGDEHEFKLGASQFERAEAVAVCPADMPTEVTAVEVVTNGMMADPVYAFPGLADEVASASDGGE